MSAREDYPEFVGAHRHNETGKYEAMIAEIDRLRADHERLSAERVVLQDALAFYGDPQTYHAVAFLFDPPCGGFDDDFDEEHGEPFYDRPMPGKLARETLRGLV